ncbi:MAG: OmpA family protein [Undibacterium curvum]|uniref:OmpA family protein n=1 Tax=Undibacterium curvum TaxID=2762294 RepID=UPI003BBDF713
MTVAAVDQANAAGADQFAPAEISERRAGAVSSALQLDGIASTRIIVQGHGEDAPAADNTNAENRQRNRRVEVLFSDLNGNFSSR